jgi:hypothetical protein
VNTLPPAVRALLQLLSGSAPDPPLTEDERRTLLELADRTHCTLFLPGHEADGRRAKNADRRRRLWLAYDEAAAALSNRGIDFVLLKGFTHAADSGLDPVRRYQSDLDFLCLPEDMAGARDALLQAGYGEYGFAELSDEFWSRRTVLAIEGRVVPALAEPDRIAFSAMHLLRHIFRNNASPAHAFELACVLNQRADDEAFWRTWETVHDPQLRALQVVAFQFARLWFECRLSPAAERECRALPEPVHAWFRDYAFSPLVNLAEPNKDALWLHMALLPRRIDRFAVAMRKLAPMRLPRPTERGERLSRIRYHTVALARALLTGWRRRRPAAASTASQTSD